jgi:hypothetical protein
LGVLTLPATRCGIAQQAGGPAAGKSSTFSPNPIQTLSKKTTVGYVNDAETDVIKDTTQRLLASSQKENEERKMIYTMDESQLLRVWTVISCFGRIRETEDPSIQSEILTNAQILLTAFVLDLEPLDGIKPSRELVAIRS